MRKMPVLLAMLWFIAMLSTVASTSAQEPGVDYAKVLLPIITADQPIRGAFGSLWISEFTLLNVSLTPVSVISYSESMVFCATCTQPPLGPGTSTSPAVIWREAAVRAAFLYVDRTRVQDVRMSLRVRDLSRVLETAGTSVPVVHETRFTSGPISMIDVPLADESRETLRVYGLDASDPTPFRVRVFARSSLTGVDQFLGEKAFALRVEPSSIGYAYAKFPAYLEIGSIRSIAETQGNRSVRVEVSSLTDRRLWAFIAITNNATQHVTVIEPSAIR